MENEKGKGFEPEEEDRIIATDKGALQEFLKWSVGLDQILGTSQAMQKIKEKIKQIACCDVNVLISGESGTGKELVARALHYLGSRSGKPFIPVNCGAIPENLFENELFGHIRGAFTDARSTHIGLVGEADKGTLFLDEIGACLPFIQVKLLRLIQEREYRPLGDSRPIHADIKIIAATNRDLGKMVADGEFREDVYYRLNIVEIKIPPLCDRLEDIPLLVTHFIAKYCQKYRKPEIRFTTNAMASLIGYKWPGNIRELENLVQHLIVVTDSPLITRKRLEIFCPVILSPKKEIDPFKKAKKRIVEKFEQNYLKKLLKENQGDVVKAAQKSGKSRTALWNLLKKHAINPRDFNPVLLASQNGDALKSTDTYQIKEFLPNP